jgi:hypothetical protein
MGIVILRYPYRVAVCHEQGCTQPEESRLDQLEMLREYYS